MNAQQLQNLRALCHGHPVNKIVQLIRNNSKSNLEFMAKELGLDKDATIADIASKLSIG